MEPLGADGGGEREYPPGKISEVGVGRVIYDTYQRFRKQKLTCGGLGPKL